MKKLSMPTITDLEKTKFVSLLNRQILDFDLAGKVFRLHSEKTGSLSKLDEYVYNTWHRVREIERKLKDLEACAVFISSYPKDSRIGKLLSREEYLYYHIEWYHVGIVGIFDRVLKLINQVYYLGLPDKYVKGDLIQKHRNIDRGLKNLLKQFDEEITSARTRQNAYKHAMKMRDGELDNASRLEKVNRENWLKESIGFSDMEMEVCDLCSKSEYRRYISDKKKEFTEQNQRIATRLVSIYEEICPAYESLLVVLSQKR